jgi:hypothetical protein
LLDPWVGAINSRAALSLRRPPSEAVAGPSKQNLTVGDAWWKIPECWPRTKTTIGLGPPIEVVIYYLGPPAVVCHRGPPSTARARVDRRTEMLAKSLSYCPRQARTLS